MTGEQDIVLIYYEDNPLTYARVESITADIKPDWYHVKLLMLEVPLQVATWLLRDTYINGGEFTMRGKKIRMARVECPPDEDEGEGPQPPVEDKKPTHAKVIPLSDLKRD